MAKTTISRITLKPEVSLQPQCVYLDYYVDDRRLAPVFDMDGYFSPFGWLKPDAQERFAAMLLGIRESDFKPNRIPLWVCPLCADYGCGVFTCQVKRDGELIIWQDFALEYDYDDMLRQDDTRRWSRFAFDAANYQDVFGRFLGRTDKNSVNHQ